MDKTIILERINNMLVDLETLHEDGLESVKRLNEICTECKVFQIENDCSLLQEVASNLSSDFVKLDDFISKLIVSRDRFKQENKLELDELTGKYYVI